MADGIDLLVEDHRKVERLFETYRHDSEDPIARDICEALTIHAEIEETALYPAVRRYVDGGDDLADRAEQEHSAIKTLIARIYDSPPESLVETMSTLRHDVEAHVRYEEAELFPMLQEAGLDTARLGEDLENARAEASERGTNRTSGT